jgi:DnaJ-class molecular chaperone
MDPNPCHMCEGTGVIGDHIFSQRVTVCDNCNGTGEEPELFPAEDDFTLP